MSSDAVPGRRPEPEPEPDATPEACRQRAVLLADLGRYDEGAGELAVGLAAAPDDAELLTTLARIHLAADQPAEALVAADRAVAAAPGHLPALVARAMALSGVRRFGEAAQIATELLTRWPADPYAQRTGAALLSESRNGQEALNAAWLAVSLAPREAEAHLVLAVVAARLRLFDIAQRAYAEALELDATIDDAQRDVGVVRLERRRWAHALEELADAAVLPVQVVEREQQPEVVRPARPVLEETHQAAVDAVARVIRYAAGGTLVAVLLTALMAVASAGVSRAWAGVVGVVGLGILLGWSARRLPGAAATMWASRRRLAVATYATLAAPALLVLYAVVGGPWPLVTALALAGAAELLVVLHRD